HEGRQENRASATGLFLSGERTETMAATAAVQVGGGAFSTRQILLGRVYEDVNRNGEFDDEDEPLAGVRLYLNSGQSVVTDSQGLYNLPSLGDGPQVISLDPVSVPSGYSLTDGGTIAGRSWTRLLRTPLGGGALLRQNFELVRTDGGLRPSAASRVKESDKQEESKAADGAKTDAKDNVKANYQTPAGAGAEALAAGGLTEASQPTAAGKYELTTTETLEPVAPGEVRILSPKPDAVVMSPAMQVEARVALNWTVKLEVNGSQISEQNIGVS